MVKPKNTLDYHVNWVCFYARYPFGITSFGRYLIWTDWDARTIQQYDRQNFQLKRAIKSFPGSSGAFYEIKTVQKPEDIGETH